MRKQIVAGNWKMNLNMAEGCQLVTSIINEIEIGFTDVVLCPPAIHLYAVNKQLHNKGLYLGAQTICEKVSGAFTGEISADMVRSVGCSYVIAGHSERRSLFGETNEIINKKVLQAIACDLMPILCIGETLQEREQGDLESVLDRQLTIGLQGISNADTVVIAYEPVWAIGTGAVATPEIAQATHAYIRKKLGHLLGVKRAEEVSILYGGSVKPQNAKSLFSQLDIDGGLIGGASLDSKSFLQIIAACKDVSINKLER